MVVAAVAEVEIVAEGVVAAGVVVAAVVAGAGVVAEGVEEHSPSAVSSLIHPI